MEEQAVDQIDRARLQSSNVGQGPFVLHPSGGSIVSDETFLPLHDLPPASSAVGSKDCILSPKLSPTSRSWLLRMASPWTTCLSSLVSSAHRAAVQFMVVGERQFLALANVGLFYQAGQPGLAPDVMLSLGVPASRVVAEGKSLLFYLDHWQAADVVVEIVSDLRGGEETDKMIAYARIGVAYYVIFDLRRRTVSCGHSICQKESMRRWSHRGWRMWTWKLTFWRGGPSPREASWLLVRP